jgi:hypothetical protein
LFSKQTPDADVARGQGLAIYRDSLTLWKAPIAASVCSKEAKGGIREMAVGVRYFSSGDSIGGCDRFLENDGQTFRNPVR